ncbi:MAG: hypothetical protein KKF62_11345 [Bacteroidetes bacterium]|nr:hypothetical protein [Bacteroidota bacterium]MBU1113947.1 hypothetical protein [Bacteroidota bacterium]MBU1798258.1 hypothetical protein [Bacteroidota bacterium]
MKKTLLILLIFTITFPLVAQNKYLDKDKESLHKTEGIVDRAGGTHNASNIGLFFENRGKLYPRRLTQGPSGEFPINSGMHYIYRINPMIGIAGNVAQVRYTENEEFEAVGGYNNPDLALIAFSDDPITWPKTGWPVMDANGNPIMKSQQDSYCVYDDLNNTRKRLNIEVAQTGYAYGINFAKNILFFKYDIVNKSTENYNGFYFSLYSDFDIGNVSGGEPEWSDDKVAFNKEDNLLYFYDDGISTEWPGGKTGMMGLAFLKTPEVNGIELGITDWHYNLYDDDQDQDTIQYGIMSSAKSLFNSNLSDKYFHVGNNSNIHYDDPSTIPDNGIDLVANMSSGPYTLAAGDTLSFYTAIIAGETYDELMEYVNNAYKIMDFNFEISKPPVTPTLSSVSGDSKVTLYWDDKAEKSLDNFSGEYDFAGYRLYKSIDDGITWEKIAEYLLNSKTGLQYSYTDTKVNNGFEYWYSITAFDRGDSTTASLESPKGSNTRAQNLISAMPLSAPAGYSPVYSDNVVHLGEGKANYDLSIKPVNNDNLSGNEYNVGFYYVAKKEKGKLKTNIEIMVKDSVATEMTGYGIHFLSSNTYELINLDTDEEVPPNPRTYLSGREYKLNKGLSVKLTDMDKTDTEHLPKAGDYISVHFGINAIRNNSDTVISTRQFIFDQEQATNDGVIISMHKPNSVQDVSRIGGNDNIEISFDVDDEANLRETTYLISVLNNSIDADKKAFIKIEIKDSFNESLVATFESLYTMDTFVFNGLVGTVEFNPEVPPSAGNIFSVTSIIPTGPNLQDSYTFSISGSSIDKKLESTEMSNIKVVPNPYIVSSLYEPEFGELRKEPLRQIQFINLPSQCTISIFTVDADLVKTLYHDTNSGNEHWDLKAEGGREIAPGIYIYVVKTATSEYMNRFAIIK